MAKWTKRDRIWNVALSKDGEIEPEDLAEKLDVGEHTVRDCLNCIAEAGAIAKIGGEGRDPAQYFSVVNPAEDAEAARRRLLDAGE